MAANFTPFAPDANKTAGSRMRRFGELLQQQGSDTSPVYGWGQGLARVLAAFAGANQLSKADEMDKQEREQGYAEIFGDTAADQWTNPDTGEKVGATKEENQFKILENSTNPYTQNFRLMKKMADMENQNALELAKAKAQYDIPNEFKTYLMLRQMENGGNPAPNLMPQPAPAAVSSPQAPSPQVPEEYINIPEVPNTDAIDTNEAANLSTRNPDGSFKMPGEAVPVATPQFAGGDQLPAPAQEPSMADQFLQQKLGMDEGLPPKIFQLQNDLRDEIGTVASLNAKIKKHLGEIKNNTLDLGAISNKANEVQNYLGFSDPKSRAYQSFMADLERMRNDSLRLNKGVQTDGDSERAWNEIIKNPTDTKLVESRLTEIQGYNELAAKLKQGQLDNLRKEYKKEPIDVLGEVNKIVNNGKEPNFATEADAEAANLPSGTIVIINGRRARID